MSTITRHVSGTDQTFQVVPAVLNTKTVHAAYDAHGERLATACGAEFGRNSRRTGEAKEVDAEVTCKRCLSKLDQEATEEPAPAKNVRAEIETNLRESGWAVSDVDNDVESTYDRGDFRIHLIWNSGNRDQLGKAIHLHRGEYITSFLSSARGGWSSVAEWASEPVSQAGSDLAYSTETAPEPVHPDEERSAHGPALQPMSATELDAHKRAELAPEGHAGCTLCGAHVLWNTDAIDRHFRDFHTGTGSRDW